MLGSPGAVVFALLLAAHGSVSTKWPIKTVDTRAGLLCDPATERYLKVQVHDYHDHPRVRLKVQWSPRVELWDRREEGLQVRTAVYDMFDGDEGPTDGRVQLDLFVCVPYGGHSLQLNVGSYSDGGSTLEGRTTWMAEDGLDVERMRGTSDTGLIPGSYTWHFDEKTGSYRAVGGGAGPPGESEVVAPAGRVYKGLFSNALYNHTLGQLFGEEHLELPWTLGCALRTQACSLFCREHEAFAILDGDQCFCGTGGSALDALSATYPSTSTSWWYPVSAACGAPNMMSVYSSSGGGTDTPDGSARSRRLMTPMEGEHYDYVDCYDNVATFGLMSDTEILGFMSSELCFYYCYSLSYPRFGMKNGRECGCGAPYPEKNSMSCDTPCSRNEEEICGGRDHFSVYEMLGDYARDGELNYDYNDERYEFLNCSYDSISGGRMLSANDTVKSTMSAEICFEFCNDGLNNYFGTEYAAECFCETSLSNIERKGLVHWRECGMSCEGTTTGETCGAFGRISIYRINRDINSGSSSDEPGYVGCHLEDASDRVMTYANLERGNMTNQMCRDNCGNYGFTYSGTQMGDECWCGNAYGAPSNASSCDVPCAGDSSEFCGGIGAVTVFDISLIHKLNVTS